VKAIKDQYHLNDEQIALYVDALRVDKADDLSPEILSHIKDCKPCHRQAIDLYSMLGDVDYAQVGPHPTLDKKAAKVLNMPRLLMRLAAAIALLIVASFFFNKNADINNPGDLVNETTPVEHNVVEQPVQKPEVKIPKQEALSQPAKEEVIVQEEPIKIAPPKQKKPQPKSILPATDENVRDLYAANFVPSEELDEMGSLALRSTSFKVLQPKQATSFKPNTKISFQWEGDDITYFLILMDNKGTELHKATLNANSFELDVKLVPGLYYWKLDREDDLLHVGSFTVE